MDAKPVLIVARPAEGGIRSHIISLIENLDRARFSAGLAAPAKLLASVPDELAPHCRYSLPIRARSGPLDILAAARVAALARSGYGLVHAHGIRAGFVCAMARSLAQFSLIVTYHNLPPQSKLSRLAINAISGRAVASIAVSRAVADALGGPAAAVIPNGIDLARFNNAGRDQARARLNLKADDIAVVCVARLSPDKGVDILIRAARLVPEATIVIAGDGPERNRLETGAPANVRFLGYVSDVSSMFAAADIAVVPSRREGQGIAALEAMASGVAVIASDVGGLPEMIAHDTTGILTPPDDARSLADSIGRLVADAALRASIADAGKNWTLANADVRLRIKQIEDVYDSVPMARGSD